MADGARGWYHNYEAIIDDLSTEKIVRRNDGVSKLRSFISSKRNLELLEKYKGHNWTNTLQALFQLTHDDRNAAYKPSHATKATAPTIKRLEESTSLLRYLVEKIHKKLNKRTIKSIVKHVVDMIVIAGALQSFALTYLRILRTLLNYSPHLEHLEGQKWLDIVSLCFSGVLGDEIRVGRAFIDKEIMDVEIGDGIVGGRHGRGVSGSLNSDVEEDQLFVPKSTATQEDIEFLAVIEVVFRSTSSPFQDFSRIIFRKFVRFFDHFEKETTAHYPAVTALNHAFAQLELNDHGAMSKFGPELWPHLLKLWTTKSAVLKEQVVMAMKYLLPFIDEKDGAECIKGLYEAILGEPDIRWRLENLNIDFLRIGINTVEEQEKRAFTTSTFRSAEGFSNYHAISWTLLELGAACLSKLYQTFETPRATPRATPDALPATPENVRNKRRKIEDPLTSLVDSLLSPASIDTTTFRLQLLLFLIERHWFNLNLSIIQRITRTLIQILAHEDAQIQCWSFFVVAAIASNVGQMEVPMEWEPLWHISIRRIQNPLVCRLAAHTANVIFTTGRIDINVFTATIESIGVDLDIQGPNFPSDSVCTFLSTCLIIASNDVRLYRLDLPGKIFSWLTSAWKPLEGIIRPHTISQIRPRADPFHSYDLSTLVMQICGLQKIIKPVIDGMTPDGPISTMAIAAVETHLLQRFLIDGYIPPYSLETPSSPPTVSNTQASSKGLQRRISKWFEKMMKDLAADGDEAGDAYWSMVSVEKARRYFDLAIAVFLVEGAFNLNGLKPDMASIDATNTLLTHLTPILDLKKWSPVERAIVLGGIAPLFVELPAYPSVQYPVILDPGIASSIDRTLLPHRKENLRKANFDSNEFKLLQSIWSIPSCQRILSELIEGLKKLLTVATSSSDSTQATQTQQSQAGRSKDDAMIVDDDFGEIKIAETAHLKALVQAERAADLCMSIIVRGIVSGVMIVTQAGGSVRVPTIVNALVQSDGNASISIAEHTFNAVRYGIMNFRVTEAEEILTHFGATIFPSYQFAYDERAALAGLLFLESTAELWIGTLDGDNTLVEVLGINARELCGWYSNKMTKNLLPSWRVRLRFTSFLDTYLSIDQNQARWIIHPTDQPVIAPTAILPTLLKDRDFRVRFKASTSTAELFNFMERNGHPSSKLFNDIKNHIVNDLAQVETVITQMICLASIMVVSGERRRTPYNFLHEILSATNEDGVNTGGRFSRQVEALYRGIAVRLGIRPYSALYRNYSQWLFQKELTLNKRIPQYSPKVSGYNSKLELIGDTFKETGGVLLTFNQYDEFKKNCDALEISVSEGILRCLPEAIALTVLEFWSVQVDNKDVNTTILDNAINSLVANALGENNDAHQVSNFIKSISDQVIASLLCHVHENKIEAGVNPISIKSNLKAADTFRSILKLEMDLELAEAPTPHRSLKVFDKGYSWIGRLEVGITNVATLYSVIQELFHQIHRSLFLDDQRRLLMSVALALGYGRRHFNDPAFLASLATSLIRLLPIVDLLHLTANILTWCLEAWNTLENEKKGRKLGETGTDLCKNLLYVAQAAQLITDSTNEVRIKARSEELSLSMDTLIRLRLNDTSPVIREIALLWPTPVLPDHTVEEPPNALASPFLPKEKFRLIRSMALDPEVQITGPTLWRLLDSVSSTQVPTSQQSLDLANLIYRGNGKVSRPELDEELPSKIPLIDLNAELVKDDDTIKAVIAAKVFNLLDDRNPVLAHVASITIRAFYSLHSIEGELMDSILSTQAQGVAGFLSIEELLRPHQVRIREKRKLAELQGGDWIQVGKEYKTWIRRFTKLLADCRAEGEEFYAQLVGLLDNSAEFAGDLLPNLVHSILFKGVQEKDNSAQQLLSEYLTALLSSPTTDLLCIHSLVDLVISLRRQTKALKSPLSCDRWLNIPWIILATAAIRCQSYFSALLFLELAHEYDGLLPKLNENKNENLEAQAVQIHYAMYAALDEPDGFYGLQSSNVRDALVKRYHHENRWSDAFQLHGADYESIINDGSVTLGVMESLSSFGFNRLAMSILQPSRTEGGSISKSIPMDLPYRLATQTNTWDLPIEPRAIKTSAVSLYSALRAIHTSRDNTTLIQSIESSLNLEVFKLSAVSIDLPIPNAKALSTVLALREVRAWVELDLESIDPDILQSMIEIPALLSFEHSKSILTTRISLLRSVRIRESLDSFEERISDLGEQVTRAERACLLQLSTVARERGFIQVAMNSVTSAQSLVERGERDILVEEEFANVLWSQGEHGTAISVLDGIYPKGLNRPATVSARLGEWITQTKIKATKTILQDYFEPATAALEQATPIERTQVFNAFAIFADGQYQHSLIEIKEQRKRKELCIQLQSVADRAVDQNEAGSFDETLKSQLSKAKANADAAAGEVGALLEEAEATTEILLRRALENYGEALISSEKHDSSVLRFCALWLAHASHEKLNKTTVARFVDTIPSHKFVFLAHQLSARLDKSSTSFSKSISRLVTTICRDHPLHCLYQVNALRKGNLAVKPTSKGSSSSSSSRRRSSTQVEAPKTSRILAANEVFDKVKKVPTLIIRVQAIEIACDAYIEWANWDLRKNPAFWTGIPVGNVKNGTWKKNLKIPRNALILTSIINLPIPPPTLDLVIDLSCRYENVPTMVKYDENFFIPGGINYPTVVTCTTSDGQIQTQLLKGLDDSRQDAVIQQAFGLMNKLLARDEISRSRDLRIKTYKVIPLAEKTGIIEFVKNTKSLADILLPAYAEFTPRDSYTPAEARREMSTFQKDKSISNARKAELFNGILTKLPPVMRNVFFQNHKLPSKWFDQRLIYSKSLAVNSIVGSVLGLGDRHVSNILMDYKRGELVMIDLGIAFDQGRRLPIPELVPFRLTQNSIDGLGMTGVNGVFRRCAEETLRVLREGSSEVITVVEVFKYDPLQSWALSMDLAQRVQGPSPKGGDGSSNMVLELPDDADRALEAISNKLGVKASVEHTVNELIATATDSRNLGNIFCGWQPYL